MMSNPKVDAIVETYLSVADAEAPGLVEGLYLEGSAALGDYRPGASDVDFVAVTASEAPSGVVERIHARLGAYPFEGCYLTWDDLSRDPAELGTRPRAHAGKINPRGGLNPVTWHTLAQNGLTCRGPKPDELEIWHDPAALAAWTDGNLDRYWRRLVARASHLASPGGWPVSVATTRSGSSRASPGCTTRWRPARSPPSRGPGSTRWRCSPSAGTGW